MKTNGTRDGEEQFRELVSALNSLKKVNAPDGFEANLYRRINKETLKPKESILKRFFTDFSLAHSLVGATVAAMVLIALFVPNLTSSSNDVLFVDSTPRDDVVALKTDEIQPYDFHVFAKTEKRSQRKIEMTARDTENGEENESMTMSEETYVSSPPPNNESMDEPTVSGFSGGSGNDDNTIEQPEMIAEGESYGSANATEEITNTTDKNFTRKNIRLTSSAPSDDGIEEIPYTGRSEVNYRAQFTTLEDKQQLDSLRTKVFGSIDSTSLQ